MVSASSPREHFGRLALVSVGLLAAIAVLRPVVSGAADRGALWRVVHDICVPDSRLTGHPAPCTKVDTRAGYAVLKDLEHRPQLILTPTRRLTGIEDPRLLAPDAPNYWALAWANRDALERRARRPLRREEIGLVVNSVEGRSQDQLHIHLDCVRADVAAALGAAAGELRAQWRPLPETLAGQTYRARWLTEADLANEDPFKLVAEIPGAREAMGRQTVALVGATAPDGTPGFVLLEDEADPARDDHGHAEDLLDHHCGRT